MLRKLACSQAYQLASRPSARKLINSEMPSLVLLSGTGIGGLPACPPSVGIRGSAQACKLSMTASCASSLDDMDDTITEFRGRLVSVESTQQEQLSLQRDMADDLEALLESFNGIQDRLDILNSLIMAQTKLFLAAQSGRETAGSCSESEEPLQPQDAGNARSPEAPEEQSQG